MIVIYLLDFFMRCGEFSDVINFQGFALDEGNFKMLLRLENFLASSSVISPPIQECKSNKRNCVNKGKNMVLISVRVNNKIVKTLRFARV